MSDFLALYTAALCWAAVGLRLRATFRDRRNAALRSLWLALVALGLALTVFVPPVYRSLDRLLGVPNASELIGHCLVLVSAWQGRAVLPRLADAVVRRRWAALDAALLAAVLAGLTWLFVLAPVDVEAPGSFTRRYAGAPYVAEYWALFLAYLGFALGHMALLSRRYARIVPRRFLRVGLHLVSAAGCVGLVYFAHWGLPPLLHRLGLPVPGFLDVEWRPVSAAAVSLLLVGATIPQWGPLTSRWSPRRLWQQHRALRRLRPLWLDVYRATPDIALEHHRSRIGELLDLRALDYRLYRRVVEIRDGRLALLPYMDEATAEDAARRGRAAGLRGEALEAVVEAARIGAAVDAKAAGRRADSRRTPGAPALRGDDLSGEVAVLEKVAAAYRSSAVVRQLRAAPAHRAAGAGKGRDSPVKTETRRPGLATVVTEATAPAPTALLLLLAVAWHSAPNRLAALLWGVVAVLFAAVLPFAFILRGVRRGHWEDHHVSERHSRRVPLLVGMASVVVGLALLAAGGAPRELVALVAAMLVGLAVTLLVSLRWKISIHTSVIGGTAVILGLVFGWPLLVVAVPVVLLVAWARVRLGAHSAAQVASGAAVGALVAALVYPVLA